jgi:hypothetical protein
MADSGDVIGRHVGPYEILSLLGAGGMGVVYREAPEARSRRRNQGPARFLQH